MFLGTTIFCYVVDWFCFMHARQEQIQYKRTEWIFSITDTATKLLLWCQKMWHHQHFHHLFCRSKVENENSKIIRLKKLKKNYQGVNYFWRKLWLAYMVSLGSAVISAFCGSKERFFGIEALLSSPFKQHIFSPEMRNLISRIFNWRHHLWYVIIVDDSCNIFSLGLE